MYLHLAFVVVGDNEVGHRQAQSGALADFLGGEKRLERTLADVLRHADAVVLDLNLGPRRIEARAQGNAPGLFALRPLVDGLRGVLQQVQQYLLQLVGNARHRTQFGVELTDDVLALEVETDGQIEIVTGDLHGLIDQGRQVARR